MEDGQIIELELELRKKVAELCYSELSKKNLTGRECAALIINMHATIIGIQLSVVKSNETRNKVMKEIMESILSIADEGSKHLENKRRSHDGR
jgi:hypothetical protein